jgi:uncharacterized iron-regulated protein
MFKYISFLIFLFVPLISTATPSYKLRINVDTANSSFKGYVEFIPDKNKRYKFYIQNLDIKSVSPKPEILNKKYLIVEGKKKEPVKISFMYSSKNKKENYIDNEFIYLIQPWYPFLDELCVYDLFITLPKGFEAISEANKIIKVEDSNVVSFKFYFPYPVENINLIASKNWEIVEDNYENIKIYGYFFKNDKKLAKNYIEYTKNYLQMYEKILTRYPYKRFSIVENYFQTGYSMPTFTLLGTSVVKLPFIVKTSLGHEIVHQWFGNSVYIDYSNGNWAEGLTTYFADHYFKKLENKDWEYRKFSILDYLSYVKKVEEFPVKEFIQKTDKSSQAIGYGKVMMIFHMLKNLVGEENFNKSIKEFIKEYSFKKASWEDIKRVFEKNYGDLDWFFVQWLNRKGKVDFHVKNLKLEVEKGKFKISFDIIQKGEPFKAEIPVQIFTNFGVENKNVKISKEKEHFDIFLEDEPIEIVFDKDYDVFRNLYGEEIPPLISQVLGSEKVIAVISKKDKEKYKYILSDLKNKNLKIKTPEEFKYSDLKENLVILFDKENPIIPKIFGKISKFYDYDFITKKNPVNSSKPIAVINGENKKYIKQYYLRSLHYGHYSRVSFQNNRAAKKDIYYSKRGMIFKLRKRTTGIYVPQILDINSVIRKIEDNKIIYVGENHNQLAHHINQLNIIKGIYKKHKKIAIGMEMFQRPYQKYLDEYIHGKIDEKTFLKKTHYFETWGFDYNLYKPILDFARKNKIPVVALNIDNKINRKVFRKGIDSLTPEEKQKLPKEIDFTNETYKEYLKSIFGNHNKSKMMNFDYFYQAQLIWDETMAETIDKFLRKNPEYQMVVIAGNGHLKYGYGIPNRVYRRDKFSYKIVLNDEEERKDIADYILYPEKISYKKSVKLGVYLSEKNGVVKVQKVLKNSVAEKIGLKKGDVILKLNNFDIKSVEDLKIALFYLKNEGKMKVKRRKKIIRLEINLKTISKDTEQN